MRVTIMLAALLLCCGGCGDADPSRSTKTLYFDSLAGMRASPDTFLRDELIRIEEEGGTPEQLAKVEIAEEQNAAAGFRELFPKGKLASILFKSEKLFPDRVFDFNTAQLQKAIDFRRKYEPQRLAARKALNRPKCDLGIDFTKGYNADISLVDAMYLCARLEAFAAAEALADERANDTVESLAIMLKIASLLDDEEHFAPRIKAAQLRTEAFRVLQAVVKDPRTKRKHLVKLREMIENLLQDWPDDARLAIGDRALGLLCYEMVRVGNLPFLLTVEEQEQFRKEGVLNQITQAAQRTVDADTRYYLDTMRRIIESCDRPFHERTTMFSAIKKELAEKQNTSEFPFVAGRLLLVDAEDGHATMATDRAQCEAWAIALALALGENSDYRVNPLSGMPYEKRAQGTPIVVSGICKDVDGNNFSISVPIPRDGQPTKKAK